MSSALAPVDGRFAVGRLAVVLAAMLVYANSLPNELVWDDHGQIEDNLLIRSPGAVARAFVSDYWGDVPLAPGHYRPLVVATYALNWRLGGAHPLGYRVVNILLHAACSFLVATLAAEIGLAAPFALLAGLVFALHPLHVEPTVWIVGRAELGAALCSLAVLVVSLRGWRTAGSRLHLAVGPALVLAGLLFKESAATTIAAIPVLHLFRSEGSPARRISWALAAAIPFGIALLVYFAMRRGALGPTVYTDDSFFAGVSGAGIFLTMTKVVLHCYRLLLVPFPLRAHYDLLDFPVPGSLLDPTVLVALCVHAAVVAAIAVGLWRRSAAAAGGALTLAGLLPYLHVVPFPWLVADRFLYLASAGFAIVAACAVRWLASRVPWGTRWRAWAPSGAALLAVLAYAPLTVARNLDWHDDVTFFSKMLEQEPDLAAAHVALGYALLARSGREAEGIRHLDTAQRLGWDPETGTLAGGAKARGGAR